MKKMYIIISSEEQNKPIVQTSKPLEEPKVNIEQKKEEELSMKDMVLLMKGFQEQNNVLVSMLKDKGVSQNTPAFDMKEFTRVMELVSRKSNENTTSRTFGISPINMEDVDPEDILEVPAYFFSYSYKYAIYDDLKNGVALNPPYGAVKFNPLFRSSPTGKVYGTSARYSNISYALVYSKKQSEWLKKHSLFGVYFFENIGAAQSVDYLEAESIAKAYQTVQGLSGFKLRHRCQAEGIDITSIDDSVMRQKLIDKISKNLQQQNKEIKESNLKSALTKEVAAVNFGGSAAMSTPGK